MLIRPLQGLTICYFGHYESDYPRHRVLKKALRRAGAEIVEVNDNSLCIPLYVKLFTKSLRCHFDLMIVAFPSHTDILIARLVCSLKRVPLIFDALVSGYDTTLDRQSAHPKSLTAKKAYWIDKSQAHLCLGIFGTSAKAQHGIPNKVFFALATKRPVVTGDTPAMREIFTHGENIWLCPMVDAAALADSITELKHRPDLRAEIAQKGYELFVREFSIEAIKQGLVAIILEANRRSCDLRDVLSEQSVID